MHLGWGSARLCPQLLSSNVVSDLMLLESLLDNLMAQQKDTSASVRRLVLRGLANGALGSPDKVTVGQPSGALLLGKGRESRATAGEETGRPSSHRLGGWAAGRGMAWAHGCVWPLSTDPGPTP